MAWTSPMTAVSGAVLTAAQWNANVRDNLLQTGPGLASAAGQYFMSSAANALVARTPATSFLATSESAGVNAFANLATVGPTVTLTTGSKVLILISSSISFNAANTNTALVSYAVSGATTINPTSTITRGMLYFRNLTYVAIDETSTTVDFLTTLTPGTNTFTMKYFYAGNAAGGVVFQDRQISVFPLN